MVPLPEVPPVKYVYVERQPPHVGFDKIMYRIPGRSAARGEITHKMFKDMNRKERRAVISGRKSP